MGVFNPTKRHPIKVLKLVESTVSDNPGVGEILIRWIASPINPIDLGKINGHFPGDVKLPCIGGSEGVGLVEKVRHFIHLVESTVSDNPGVGEILIRWIASPINPIDLGKINGHFPGDVKLPCIGGSEGVGLVEKIGSGVKSLVVGDHVIPFTIKHPTWTNYAIINADDVRAIDKRLKIEFAATLLINPPTAYCMLKEFVHLEPGDYIIQNCANSAVGQCVVQLAKEWGFKTINLVRDRAEINHAMKMLENLGADLVLTETQFEKKQKDVAKTLHGPVKLALNSAGGHSALLVSSALDRGGTVVTYGEMSGKNPEFLTSSFIFKNIRAVGFAITDFLQQPGNEAKCDEMFRQLQELNMNKRLMPPEMDKWRVQDFSKAITRAVEGGSLKQLLIFDTAL
ncbi:putative trans-2-enoyl-CoA reductase 2, mitochondrial [Toxocara canis]|uniref:Enoyl-[acyl-carrier-protein] reductase, mitochondrial n=1 Tax=Toxocara canis TaxID=6265 RepID=A0A0B2VYM7_TOXCA|nr:putative trans-2-enoyl-CoA reductase 2, mitochondrial [Toxocara canis]